jgi:16S rRNA (uracil1498-N3)-methyltransferase
MSHPRFFATTALPDAQGAIALPLSVEDLHHAVRVLRLQPGERIVLVEPGGGSWVFELERVSSEGLTGSMLNAVERPHEPRITLVQGILKGSGMDEVVRHAVELGAEHIVPLVAERTVVRLAQDKADARTRRWQRIAEGAARQSQRTRVPTVLLPVDIAGLQKMISGLDTVVVLWEESTGDHLSQVLGMLGVDAEHPDIRVGLIVGPEGGLGCGEVEALVAAGAHVVSLGTAILRAQTATLAALTLVVDALGAL